MRNLKRVLSLALALVMVLGMMVITTSAAKFTDADEITYTEAVDVMSAIGVINGYKAADGTFYFDGDKQLTRAEGAALVCYMLMGKDNADKLTGSGQFTDVPADHWAAGEIDYCFNLGYIAGNGDGTFNPGGPLTTIGFGRMLLGALGYDGAAEGYTGTNWATAISSGIIDIGLDVKGVAMDAQLTREEAAQMAFQSLTKTMVRYTGGVEVSTGDTTVTVGATRSERTNYDSSYKVADYNAGVVNANCDDKLQLCEELFPALMLDGGAADDFVRPASHRWFLDTTGNFAYTAGKETVAHNAMKVADYTATVTAQTAAAAAAADADDLATDVNKVLGLKGNSALTNTAAVININGGADAGFAGTQLQAGDEIEVYVDSEGAITNLIITRYTLVKIADITDLTKVQLEALTGADMGSTKHIDLAVAGGTTITNMCDSRFEGFNYAKNDYVLVALKGTTDVLAAKAATVVSGKVDATKDSTYRLGEKFYSIEGTNYIGVSAPTLAIGTEGTWVLDVAGKIAAVVEQAATTSGNYAYIYRVTYAAGGVDADGFATNGTYTAYAVLADGSKVSYPLATVAGNTATNVYIKGMKPATTDTTATDAGYLGTTSGAVKVDASTIKQVVAYDIVNGKFEVVAATDSILTAATESIDKDDAKVTSTNDYFCNDATQFIFADNTTDATKITVDTATGYKNVSVSSQTVMFVANAQSKAVLFAFVDNSNAYAVSTDTTVAVLMDASPVVTKVNNQNVYTYSIVVDGVAAELALNSTQKTALETALSTPTAGDVFSYSFADGVLSATKHSGTTNNVAYVNGNQVVLDDDTIVDLSTVKIYTVSYDKKTVSAGGALTATASKDGNTVVCVDAGGTAAFEYIFVMNEENPNA